MAAARKKSGSAPNRDTAMQPLGKKPFDMLGEGPETVPGAYAEPAAAQRAETRTSPARAIERYEVTQIEIDRIRPSKTNPRRSRDEKKLTELALSMGRVGVLQPIVVRRIDDLYEIVCGHCRCEAAKLADLVSIPAIVRDLNELEALEVQLVENIQRSDLHPMEEAEGYHALMKHGYDAARIAERIGRSVAYVYDRIKLLELGKRGRELFLEGVLTAGHAILLARLTEKDQGRALQFHECLEEESTLWDPLASEKEAKTSPEHVKAISVRELQAWIDKNVRFTTEPDPMLFPETALDLTAAREEKRMVVAITFENFIPDHARDGKTFFPKSWKRADGEHHSRTCDRAVLGFVAVGPRRGESFNVCVDKDRCTVHWGTEIKQRQKRAAEREKQGKGSKAKTSTPAAAAIPAWKKDEERRRERDAAYAKLRPMLTVEVLEKVKQASVGGNGQLARILLGKLRYFGMKVDNRIPPGASAEGLLRHAAWQIIAKDLERNDRGRAIAKQLGIDIKKIEKELKPAAKKAPAKSKKGAKR
jgi:ParB/RepB/Spo0J family partition protein